MGIQVGGEIFSHNNTFNLPNESGTLATEGYAATKTLDQVLAAGATLNDNREVILDGKNLVINDAAGLQVLLNVGNDQVKLENAVGSIIQVSNDDDETLIRYKDANTQIRLSTAGSTITGNVISPTLLAAGYATDGAAAAGGIAVGGLYHTAGVVKIRLV